MQKDSIQFITDNYGKLTKNEKLVADYILTHFSSAIGMSVHELSETVNVSAATPVRFAQHMGFNGYKELRLFLATHQAEHEDLILDIRQASGSLSDSVEKALSSEIEAIKLTLKELDYPKFTDIAKKIVDAKQILLFGMRTSYLVCCDFMYKLQRTGKVVHCTDNPSDAAVFLSGFNSTDMVIGFSHSGETSTTCDVLALAKDLGIYTVAATTFSESTICNFADQVLHTQTRESPLHKIALTSRISQLATADALFMTYFSLDYDNCMNNLNKVSTNISRIQK